MHLKMLSVKWRPYCPGGYELTHNPKYCINPMCPSHTLIWEILWMLADVILQVDLPSMDPLGTEVTDPGASSVAQATIQSKQVQT